MSMLKLYSIAFKNKIKIQRKDIEGGFAKPELKEVVIPQDIFHTETRQTLAHELGHLLHPLGSCAPDEEVFMVNMVGFATDDVLKQEFAAWEWAIDHTEIDPRFLFKNLWGYCRMTAYQNVKSVGKDFQQVWTMIEDLIPVREPPRNTYTMYDTIIRQLDEMVEEQIPTVECDDYRKKVNPTVEYGREKEKRVISKQMIDEIMRADPIPKVIEEQMKRYIDGLF